MDPYVAIVVTAVSTWIGVSSQRISPFTTERSRMQTASVHIVVLKDGASLLNRSNVSADLNDIFCVNVTTKICPDIRCAPIRASAFGAWLLC